MATTFIVAITKHLTRNKPKGESASLDSWTEGIQAIVLGTPCSRGAAADHIASAIHRAGGCAFFFIPFYSVWAPSPEAACNEGSMDLITLEN